MQGLLGRTAAINTGDCIMLMNTVDRSKQNTQYKVCTELQNKISYLLFIMQHVQHDLIKYNTDKNKYSTHCRTQIDIYTVSQKNCGPELWR